MIIPRFSDEFSDSTDYLDTETNCHSTGIDDFPDLEVPSKAASNDHKNSQNTGETGKKKKNKGKKGGFVGEDLVSARPSKFKTLN